MRQQRAKLLYLEPAQCLYTQSLQEEKKKKRSIEEGKVYNATLRIH